MNTQERLIALIDTEENTSVIQKNSLKGFVERACKKDNRDRDLRQFVSEIATEPNIDEIVFSDEDVIIYTVNVRKNDEWSQKYPFRFLVKRESGAWLKANEVSPTFEIAFLYYLGYKYDGLNSRFANFALKMLDIKIEE